MEKGGNNSLFECNICFDSVKEPVVTMCGHLYCWPCIHKWMTSGRSSILCPVCKSGISVEKIIPLYGRGGNDPNKDPREANPDPNPTPPRPRGVREEAPNSYSSSNTSSFGHFGGAASNGFHITPGFGFGIFPAFHAQYTFGSSRPSNRRLTPEEQQNQAISRAFLVIFVIILFAVLFSH